MSVKKTPTKKQTGKSPNLVRVLKVVLLSAAISFGITAVSLGLPKLLSSDPCLRDWDIECTYAPGIVRALDVGGLVLGMLAWTLMWFMLVASVILSIIIIVKKFLSRKKKKQ